MRRLLKKSEILTVPNLLSLVRLALIPLIVWLYCGAKRPLAAIGVIVLSGISDIVDGYVARKYSMVSDLGKILDPIADKLTQAALLVCLLFTYDLMLALIVIFVAREMSMIVMGMVAIKRSDEVNSAKWYGKLNTVVIYGVMVALILFPRMPLWLANSLICLCGGMILVSLALYARFYKKFLASKKQENVDIVKK